MFDKYFCKKFHAKEITFGMIIERYGTIFNSDNVLTGLYMIGGISVCIGYLTWFMGIEIGLCVSCLALITGVLCRYFEIPAHITVATCPLKK